MEESQLSEVPELKGPVVNATVLADEFKKFLWEKRMDLIDYGYTNIDCWPPVDDKDNYPETMSFGGQWEAMFNVADTMVDDDGNGFPEEVAQQYEAELKKAQLAMNSDAAFWTKLRADILPLYAKSKHYEEWKKRWKMVKLFYDPISQTVTTTQMLTNKKTGERSVNTAAVDENGNKRSDGIVRETVIPACFVIRVF